jgi:hypothetical protein
MEVGMLLILVVVYVLSAMASFHFAKIVKNAEAFWWGLVPAVGSAIALLYIFLKLVFIVSLLSRCRVVKWVNNQIEK